MYPVPWSIKSHVISPSNLLSNILSHLDLQTAYRDTTYRDATAYSLHIFAYTDTYCLEHFFEFFVIFLFLSPVPDPCSVSLSPSLLVVGALRCDGERREEEHQNNKRGTTFS